MSEKRGSKRHARRLKVRFGEAGAPGFEWSGFTNDVSATGLFVASGHHTPPGTRLHLEVTLQDQRLLYLEGVVTREVKVPPELRQVVKAGFGVRYLQGAELMGELVPALKADHARAEEELLTFSYEDPAAWRAAVEHDFSKGGAFAWLPRALPRDTVVTATFDLRFLPRRLSFEARVVQSLKGPDGRFGHTLLFLDPTAATAALTATLGSLSGSAARP